MSLKFIILLGRVEHYITQPSVWFMAIIRYLYEPAEHTVYKVQEDCCYTKVVFQGPQRGIYQRNDRENEVNGPLMCQICDAKRTIVQVSEDFLHSRFQLAQKGLKRVS